MLVRTTQLANQALVLKDIYELERFPRNSFDFILDIGANVGVFSRAMRTLNRKAKIIAIEPNKQNFAWLSSNLIGLDITLNNRALGNGDPLWFRAEKTPHPLDHRFVEEQPPGETYQMPSERLGTLFNFYNGFGDYCIKINCEGGEQYLINDPEAEEILRGAKKIGLMIHFPGPKSFYPDCPTWEEYTTWINSVLSTTHEVHYGYSERRKGRGVFNAVRHG
jgi:FkbM family methyltransferase